MQSSPPGGDESECSFGVPQPDEEELSEEDTGKAFGRQRSVYNAYTEQWEVSSMETPKAEAESTKFTEKMHGDNIPLPPASSWVMWMSLIAVGIVCSVVSFLVDLLSRLFLWLQVRAAEYAGNIFGFATGMLTFTCCSCMVALCAYLVTCRHPLAQGSGLPEMNCEIRGIHLNNFFSNSVILAKAVGLALARGAGLPIGKEGPFVHLAAGFSVWLLRLTPKLGLGKVSHMRHAMLTASVAVGVGVVFSAPIAGVLFALEVMPDTPWHNITYLSCLLAATGASMTWNFLRSLNTGFHTQPLISSDLETTRKFSGQPLEELDLVFHSVVLGLLCGFVGAHFTMAQQRLARRLTAWRLGMPPQKIRWSLLEERDGVKQEVHGCKSFRNLQMDSKNRNSFMTLLPMTSPPPSKRLSASKGALLCVAVAGLTSILTFCVPPLWGSQTQIISDLCSSKPFVFSERPVRNDMRILGTWWKDVMAHWTDVPEVWAVLIAMVVKVVTTALSLSLCLPHGCISPVYVLGSLFGRFYGLVLGGILTFSSTTPRELQAQFALIGAAAFGGAVCRSFSMAVAMFELTGLSFLVVPLSAATITSILVANNICPSIFDMILQSKQLPGLMHFRSPQASFAHVTTIMENVAKANRLVGYDELQKILEENVDARFFALTSKEGRLVACASRAHMLRVCERAYKGHPKKEQCPYCCNRYLDDEVIFEMFCRNCGKPRNEGLLDLAEGVPGSGYGNPVRVPFNMPLQDVVVLFVLHRCEVAFVTQGGKAIGTVSRGSLADAAAIRN